MPSASKPASHKAILKSRWLWLALLLAIVSAATGWWNLAATRPVQVVVETATLAPTSRILAVNGQIAAESSVQLQPAVTGTVLDLLADEGDVVARDAALMQLDASQQQAVLRQAQSALDKGLVAQEQAAASYGRTRDLGSLVARSVMEDASRALTSSAQEVERLRASVDEATIQLGRYTLRAPIAGTVMSRSVDPGQLVSPSTVVFTVSDLSDLVVETNVDEAYATQITPGLPATLQLIGSPAVLEGKVRSVSPKVDPDTGGLAVKVGFADPQQAPVGLTVTVNIVVESSDALTVPRTALQGDAVFVLQDGRARRTPVQVIDWPADRLIASQGLTPGDQVIVDATGLADGVAVTVAKAAR